MTKRILLFIFSVFLAGCASVTPIPPTATIAPTHTPKTIPDHRTNNFQVQYYWENGPYEPPHAYRYTITIGPGNSGRVEFETWADDSYENPQIWIESLQISETQLDQLFRALKEAEAFSKEWRQMEDRPIGGSARKLTVFHGGHEFRIPSDLKDGQGEEEIHTIYEQINSLVPQETWDDLMGRYEQFVLEHEKE